MSGNPQNLVVSPQTPTNGNMLDPKTGQLTWAWLKFFQDLAQAVNNALTILGQFNGIIGPNATIAGRIGTLKNFVQNLTSSGQLAADHLTGIVQPAQLPAADPTTQGAVLLPTGAPSNNLGSASLASTGDFDPAGAAATAQTSAFAHSDAGDVTTLAAAKSYTDGKFAPGISGTVALAKITTLGTDGSLTFANGLITAKVDPT